MSNVFNVYDFAMNPICFIGIIDFHIGNVHWIGCLPLGRIGTLCHVSMTSFSTEWPKTRQKSWTNRGQISHTFIHHFYGKFSGKIRQTPCGTQYARENSNMSNKTTENFFLGELSQNAFQLISTTGNYIQIFPFGMTIFLQGDNYLTPQKNGTLLYEKHQKCRHLAKKKLHKKTLSKQTQDEIKKNKTGFELKNNNMKNKQNRIGTHQWQLKTQDTKMCFWYSFI